MAQVPPKHVPGLPPWTVRLPENQTTPRVARAAIDEWLPDAEPTVRRAARSVVTELVANAVAQGRPPIELSVEQRGGRARIEVSDAGQRRGRRPPECWGQRIVDDLAARWGVRGDDAHVWFELPLASHGHTDSADT